uniref:YdbS-like PH domain-containing protein n=1 Tax=Rhodosorus marinus TaxID=101924 RepID=A0A7S0BN31_9RHOD|mmetsp:Transcript_22147/g.32066  ORF Transcript_22147/g.32066 Transcript_22147/m.32066 type:complete len:240 (+) Transcript_22147:122-841(+)|eukprot:CAMPEP_0184743510 /NCGR_PEP_ID=MMETSP0315-20130426/6398_1 /TAXON_ID=101924 /ORGANISM="Rhodosorus marinus, Strain UTEX LB 2760" /LENGTH=239 /DNA_ID=CAMNT_0027214853 /DNA_START=38 /DNA_END=757 /DNA_ORIENTATION=+
MDTKDLRKELNLRDDEEIIETAELTESVLTYWLWGGMLFLLVTIIGIPVILVWPIIVYTVGKTYRRTFLVVLTDSALMIREGPVCCNCIPRVEKNIFLDRIQDLTLVQNCLHKCFDVYQINVETAGKSTEGPEVKLTGLINPREFREHILRQREIYIAAGKGGDGLGAARMAPTASTQAAVAPVAGPSNAEISASVEKTNNLLHDIKDVLVQIGADLNKPNQGPPTDLEQGAEDNIEMS